jgi:hypothetical protein
MKNFQDDIVKIFNKLKANEYFAFSKYADGEFSILEGRHIDLTNKANGEFKYEPNSNDEFARKCLMDSYTYSHSDYYVGIGCPCCMGEQAFAAMKIMSKQNESNLTWANIFVNANYPYYVKKIIPEYKNHKIILIANYKANINCLPFKVEKHFKVGTNAWKDDISVVDNIKKYITANDIKDCVFLFCAGPLGNILAHKLHEHRKENFYLDVGSTLDPFMGLGGTRGYHIGASTIRKVCVWG